MEYCFKRKNNKEDISLRQIEKSGVLYLSFPMLEQIPFIRHGFSTRIGGVSEGIYAAMNLSFHRGDKEEAVVENFKRIADVIQVKVEDMVCSAQTHTTNIRVVTESDRGKGYIRPVDYQDVDAMITNSPNIVLVTFYADCVPIYLVDPVAKAIGLCHSGWRGTVGRISEKTIDKMAKEFGSKPENIRAAIGPSICRDCYEVSKDVIDEFRKCMSPQQIQKIVDEKENHKYQLDLWEANQMILQEAGVQLSNIEVTDICTCCNDELLFSHRASQGKRGNLAAFLSLHNEKGDSSYEYTRN